MPSPLVCVDIPEAHKFHSGKGTECSFPTGRVNENWNHPKANSGQYSARDHSLLFCFQSNDIFLMKTPVPCAVARLWLFCFLSTSASMIIPWTFIFKGWLGEFIVGKREPFNLLQSNIHPSLYFVETCNVTKSRTYHDSTALPQKS